MSVDQAHQRLENAEGVIQELQEHLQRVTAGHQELTKRSKLAIQT